jgi:DNA mismatch repair protein MutS
MAAPDTSDHGPPRGSAAGGRFESVLFERPVDRAAIEQLREPDYFADLNLDQVLKAITTKRREYELEPLFYAPLHDVDAVRYRHEVLRDLERADVLGSVTRFADGMRRMRQRLAQADELRYDLQKQAWFRDAIEVYCDAVGSLAQDLATNELASRGLRGLRQHVAAYCDSDAFTSLASETQALKDALGEVHYALKIQGARVTVSRFEGEPDYSAEVEATFARFKQGATRSYLTTIREHAAMDHVEEQILYRVALLYPEVFEPLAAYRLQYADYMDGTIERFDREVQLYLGYLDLIEPMRAAGLSFCYPRVSARSKEISAEATFDLALANVLLPSGGTVVGNDFRLEGPERVLVVSGPNNGGKTTFARTFGQLHHLASLGLLVPGRDARLFLPDRIYTHFEREEDIETLRGKFEDELVRVHEILEQATSSSVIVMNESFNSTTLEDALFVGTEVMRRILDLDALAVYVTFVDEIASLSDATVSMVSQIVPENPAQRTFKVLRRPADGLAYAWAIADKYGLTYERLMERIAG